MGALGGKPLILICFSFMRNPKSQSSKGQPKCGSENHKRLRCQRLVSKAHPRVAAVVNKLFSHRLKSEGSISRDISTHDLSLR